jgi:ABC-2 type transport system permease protein
VDSRGHGFFSRRARVIAALARVSVVQLLQYRVEAFIEGLLSVLGLATALVPLWVVFGGRAQVAGWTYPEMLVVVGWFTVLKAFLEGAINPSLLAVIEHIRKGTLDFVLLKPADAQLLVSFSKVDPARAIDLLAGLGIFVHAFRLLGRLPGPLELGYALLLLLAALLVMYSIAILVVSVAFVAVRVDNLIFLFGSLFDLARWPATIFRGLLGILFTWVLPLATMTTYPALALLGKMTPGLLGGALLGASLFALAARATWLSAIGRYTSAA